MELQIQTLTRNALQKLAPVLKQVAKHDGDLARQIRRSASSVWLNLHEGMYSQGKRAGSRFYDALGSASETRASIELAAIWNYIHQDIATELDTDFDRIVAILYKLSRG